MKAYMAYECHSGPAEGAVLVFANNVVEARKIAFPYIAEWTACSYLDVRVKWLKESTHTPERDEPHATEPQACKNCMLWHTHPVDENGFCQDCAEDILVDQGRIAHA